MPLSHYEREKKDQEMQTSVQSLIIRDFFPENAPWHFIQKTLHAQTWRMEAKFRPLPSEHLSLFTSFIGYWWVFLFENEYAFCGYKIIHR